MTDRAKFEEMLERLIAEDKAGAEELFHEIVVEKSREIYSSILESEEEHYDWLETQIELFNKVGEQNYLQSMM